MCGINGILSVQRPAEMLVPAVLAMNVATRHRGPDATAHVIAQAGAPALVLGHNRLAIIDLGKGGAQPMYNRAQGDWLVFNGEIYNFVELRRELEALGQVFDSRSDTEVILRAFAAWGNECVKRFSGIFAFALWDQKVRRLFLARDHLGVKPLYYAATPEGVVFSSEVRGILASGMVERKVDLGGIAGYLRFGSVQEPGTIVEGISSLPPGHVMEWLPGSGLGRPTAYWKLLPTQSRGEGAPVNHVGVRSELEQAIGRQLVSDVPYGVFLSGGIDSSAIASLACKVSVEPVRTFNIGFRDPQWDESGYAREIAHEVGSQHQELILEAADMRLHLEDLISAYDQPSCDGVNTYFVSGLIARQGIKVALSGLGGDEVFAGYNGFAKSLALERWSPLLRLAGTLAQTATEWRPASAVGQVILEFGEHDVPAPYFASRVVFNRRWVSKLLEGLGDIPEYTPWRARHAALAQTAEPFDAVNRASFFELNHYMLNMLLRDADQMSMAHGLELRVPLLDRALVECVLNLPGDLKVQPGRPKPCLLEAMGRDLPPMAYGHPKQGFAFPFSAWFTQDMEEPLKAFCLDGKAALGYNKKVLSDIWLLFKTGRLGWSRLWAIFVMDQWLRQNRVTL